MAVRVKGQKGQSATIVIGMGPSNSEMELRVKGQKGQIFDGVIPMASYL